MMRTPPLIVKPAVGMTSYHGMHHWLWKNRRPAREYKCPGCDAQGYRWAFMGCRDERWSKTSKGGRLMAWCDHPMHYWPLCAKCHRRMDDAAFQQRTGRKARTRESLSGQSPPRISGESYAIGGIG